jgi:ribosomal protein S17E
MDKTTVPFTAASYHNQMAGYISHLVGGFNPSEKY